MEQLNGKSGQTSLQKLISYQQNLYIYIALYLISILQVANSPASVVPAKCSIVWLHKMAGLPDPTVDSFVNSVLETARRVLGGRKMKKDIVTPQMLVKCVNISNLCSLQDLRILTMCLLAFAAFLRFDELHRIKAGDIIFKECYMQLFIESSKTDKYRDGAWVLIASIVLLF